VLWSEQPGRPKDGHGRVGIEAVEMGSTLAPEGELQGPASHALQPVSNSRCLPEGQSSKGLSEALEAGEQQEVKVKDECCMVVTVTRHYYDLVYNHKPVASRDQRSGAYSEL